MTVIVVLRRTVALLCVISAALYTSTCIFYSPKKETLFPAPPRKLILSWTGFFKFRKFLQPDFRRLGCQISNCDVTSNRTLLNDSHAVIFHWPDVNTTDLPEKQDDQQWFMLSFESPVHTPSKRSAVEVLGSSLDWTVTYRLDSDIVSTYGEYRTLGPDYSPEAPMPSISKFRDKSKVSWMVSHCRTHSKRETIVRQLRSHIRVDVYGKCGGKRLLLSRSRDKAYKYLADRYLFYLSFENALCQDYVTEKAFLPLYYGLIPVVYGGANYEKQLPPNSYIDILDFTSLSSLAEHLNEVSSNYTLYLQYFEWRKNYVVSKRANDNSFFCDVCAKLNEPSMPKERRRGWFGLWWYNTNKCVGVHRGNVYKLEILKKRRDKLLS